jgi:hypothetical protein
MCELQYKFSFSLVCQLETYFGLVQDCFGLVQGCFTSVWFKGASAVQGCFGCFGSVWFKIPLVQFGSVQDCFSSCSRLLQFGLVWFKIPSVWFKVALVVQGAFVGAAMVMSVVQGGVFGSFQGYLFWFKNSLVQLKVAASTVQGHVHWRLVQFLWFYLVQGCFTSNTHVGAVQGRQLLLFQLGALLWCKRDL